MDNFRCSEFISESPSTSSSVLVRPSSASTSTNASTSLISPGNSSSAVIPSRQSCYSRHHQRHRQQAIRRRGTKSDIGLIRSPVDDDMKLLLGQIPVNRKRSSTTERLNTAQWPSVLPLADKTVHCDDRCLENMFKAQSMRPMLGNCFITIQKDITAHHRQQVIDWIYDVCKEESCEPDVFVLAVSLMDRILCLHPFERNKLQAIAGACLFVASKVKAPIPLDADRIAYYTDGAVRMDQVLQGELLVLNKLNWDVSTSTALDFLDQVAARYSQLHPLSENCRYSVHRIQLGYFNFH
ncbi:unnamed protein product [Thelazia callipaeda]|uniref:Cyclin N-terminal domain-containing protein n=1 Tax=Thelazia callipaeda TaxID=103827 RepID=A0A0N5D5U2_THECL|nr:unnamed protein product [Thelazia callipaeda]